MGLILKRTIALLLILICGYVGYQAYIYYTVNEKGKNVSKNVTVTLPEFYSIGINDTLLAAYLLKIGYYQFDKNVTYDGVFNKNWLPISYNFCNSKIGSDIYKINDDMDNDGLSGVSDEFPYDYSNGNREIRDSDTIDFDNDGIPNKFDMDADGNGVADIYQAICFEGVSEKSVEQRRGFWGNDGNIFVKDKEVYLLAIKENLLSQIPNKEIIDKDAFELGLEAVYEKLLYTDEVIYQIDGKNYRIVRQDILKSNK